MGKKQEIAKLIKDKIWIVLFYSRIAKITVASISTSQLVSNVTDIMYTLFFVTNIQRKRQLWQ